MVRAELKAQLKFRTRVSQFKAAWLWCMAGMGAKSPDAYVRAQENLEQADP